MNCPRFLLADMNNFNTKRLTFLLAIAALSITCVSPIFGQNSLLVNVGEEVFVVGAGTTEDETTFLSGGILSNTNPNRSILGPVLVLNSSTVRTNRNTLTIEGTISGQSQNTLTFSSLPNQLPGSILLSGDNDYQGPTIINSGLVIATNENSLGTTDSGTSITGFGRLSLQVANSEAFVVVGTQTLGSGNDNLRFRHSEAVTNDITFQSGEIFLDETSELQSRIQLDQQGALAAVLRGDTTVVGGVEGAGNLTLQGNLTFTDAGLDHSGDVIILNTCLLYTSPSPRD